MRSTRRSSTGFWLTDRRGGSGQGRAGVDFDHGGQRGAAQHRAEGHGRGLPGDAGAIGPAASRHPRPRTWRAWTATQGQEAMGLARPRGQDRMKDGTTHWLQARAWIARRGGGAELPRPTRATRRRCSAATRGGGRGTGPKTEAMCDRQGLSLTVGLKGARRRPLEDADLRPKQKGFARWHGDGAARRASPTRTRLLSGVAKEALRAEIVERSFAPRSRRHAPDMAARPRTCTSDTCSMSPATI